jgi:RNA polymerase sigma-70 factor (ECF subfamily)
MGRFEQIYEEHREAVRAFIRRRAPEAVVEDVVSETFLVCWRKLDRVPDEPLPWLYAVARKTLANQRRRLVREQQVGAVEPASAVAEPQPVGDTVLAAAFAALSERDREVLRLIAWEGLVAQPGGGRPRLFGACLPRALPPRKDAARTTARSR